MKKIFLLLAITTGNVLLANTYKVAIPSFSHKIRPDSYRYHPMVFILRQLHETLFNKTNKGINSNILKRWSANKDHSIYRLCLKENIFFSNGKKITNRILLMNLKIFNRKRYFSEDLISSTVERGCLKIKFNKSCYGFIENMQQLNTSIIDTLTEKDDIPIGISPYKVISYNENKKLVLGAAKHVTEKYYFDKIEIKILGNKKISIDELKEFHEVNLLRGNQLPEKEELLKYFNPYEKFELQNLYVLLNSKDEMARSILSNCINQKELVLAAGLAPKDILKTFLPKTSGVKTRFSQKCFSGLKLKEKKVVEFIYFLNPERVKKIENELKLRLLKHNIIPKVIYMPKKKAISILESKEKKYDAMIVHLNGLNFTLISEILGLGDETTALIKAKIMDRKEILRIARGPSRAKRLVALENFYNQLNTQNLVIPLAELKVFAFYPSGLNIYNANSNFAFCEYKIKDIKK